MRASAVRGATCQHMTFSRSHTLLSCCVAMALYRYFQASEKSSCNLTDPRGPLTRLIPSSSIVSACEKVQSVLESEERTQSGRKGQRYSKLALELKAESWQAGSRARRGCYSQVIR